MKKWNRLVALVLAGAMTFLMLTGCCVGTGTETDPKGEKLIEETFKAYNSYRAEDDQLTNDETLRKVVDELLMYIDPETDMCDTEALMKAYDELGSGYAGGVLADLKNDGYYAINVTEETFDYALGNFTLVAGYAEQAEAAAVSYRAVNGKVYAGFMMRLSQES